MIIELLEKGEENARTAKEIANLINLDVRDVMQSIRCERLAGEPICSNSKGYYIAENEKDLSQTISRLYKQGNETIKVADAMREYHR